MSKRHLPYFESDLVRLRLLEEQDLPLTRTWRNQDSIRKWFLDTNLLTEEQHKAWFAQYFPRDDDFVFIIESKAQGCQPVGQVSIYHVNWLEKLADFGRIMIGESSARGRGLAKAATSLVLEVAFGTLALKEITLEVRSDNSPALAVYHACGFKLTGEKDGLIFMKAQFVQPEHRVENTYKKV